MSKRKLLHGDCLEEMATIEDGSIDMVLVDMPYGTTQCSWDTVIDLEKMWKQVKRIIKPNAAIVMTASQPFPSKLGFSKIDWLKYSWIWEKPAATGHLNAKRMPMKNHEDILVFYQKAPTYNPQGTRPYNKMKTRGGHNGNGSCYGPSNNTYMQYVTDYPRTIQVFKKDKSKVHPTQKPVALMEYFIKTYTNEGERVLDFCMGSGTTGVACMNLNRKFIGIELDQKYYTIAKKRIKEASK